MQVIILLLLSHQRFLYFQCFAQKSEVSLGFTSMKGCLQTYLPACAVAPKKKENSEWVQLCVDLIETAVCFTFNVNENDVFHVLQVFWMIFTDVLAVLFVRIAMLKCLGSLKCKSRLLEHL